MAQLKVFKHGEFQEVVETELNKETSELVAWEMGKLDLTLNYQYLVLVNDKEIYCFVKYNEMQYDCFKKS